MSNAPASPQLRKAINELVITQFASGAERVFYLGPDGALREVLYPDEGADALQAKRAQLLARGQLGAIVHLSIAKYGPYGQVSMVETFSDSGEAEIHTLVNWPAQGQWIKPQPDAEQTWRQRWGKEAPDEE